MKLHTFLARRSRFPLAGPGEIVATFTARDLRSARVFAQETYGAHVVVEFAPKSKPAPRTDRDPRRASLTRKER